jgi:hypothetical protein
VRISSGDDDDDDDEQSSDILMSLSKTRLGFGATTE